MTLHRSEQPVARKNGSGISCFVADKVICKLQPSKFISPGMAGGLDGLATSLTSLPKHFLNVALRMFFLF